MYFYELENGRQNGGGMVQSDRRLVTCPQGSVWDSFAAYSVTQPSTSSTFVPQNKEIDN